MISTVRLRFQVLDRDYSIKVTIGLYRESTQVAAPSFQPKGIYKTKGKK